MDGQAFIPIIYQKNVLFLRVNVLLTLRHRSVSIILAGLPISHSLHQGCFHFLFVGITAHAKDDTNLEPRDENRCSTFTN